MSIETHWVTGLGYEGETIDAFVATVKGWDISALVDVRLNAISRKRGFSKTALSQALAEAGITYLHRPVLGNPKENRADYSEQYSEAGDAARERFRILLTGTEANAAIDEVVTLARSGRVAVMCFERSQLHCHRQQIIDAVLRKLDSLIAA